VSRWRVLLVVAVALVAAVAAYLFWPANVRKRHMARDDGRDDNAYEAPPVTDLNSRAAPRDPTAPASSQMPQIPKLDRARADEMRTALRALFADAGLPWGAASDAAAAARAAPTPSAELPAGKMDPQYIQHVVQDDYFPLAKQCYTSALAKNPKLAGRIELHFRIVGDPKVGGVVDDAKLLDGSSIDDTEFRTCVRESMMSVTFDAPPEGGAVTVTYPIEFSPDDDDGGD
jgi:hypothetical protein